MGFCSKGLKKEFETAVVNEPSVLEPLKFYCLFIFRVWTNSVGSIVALLFYVHGKHLRSCRDGQLT